MTHPIRPSELKAKTSSLPDGVIDSFNKLIAKHYKHRSSTVSQEEIIREIMLKMNVTRAEVFSNCWLNIEGAYQKAGWKVTYDKPGFNETGSTYFTFEHR